MSPVWVTGVHESPRAELATYREPVTANAMAVVRAAQDAGIEPHDVDCVLTYDSLVAPDILQASRVAEYVGISPTYAATIGAAGATPTTAVALAASLIGSGTVETVAIAHSDLRSSAGRETVIAAMAKNVGNPEFEAPFGPVIPTMYALLADWLLGAWDVTRTDLADIAVQARQWAALHPNALRPEGLTRQQVLDAPRVAGVLGKYDCCLVTDFSGAVIVTGRSHASGVRLRGWGGAGSHEEISQVGTDNPLESAERAGEAVYESAGIGPEEVDIAMLYDSFTSTVAQQLLAYRLIGDRPLGALLAEGTGPGGRLPLNTHGGLLAGSTSGLFHLVEAVRQLAGRAGPRQVDGAVNVLVTNVGGIFSNHSALILERVG